MTTLHAFAGKFSVPPAEFILPKRFLLLTAFAAFFFPFLNGPVNAQEETESVKQLPTADHANQVVRIENYFLTHFYQNNYWSDFEKNWTGSKENFQLLYPHLHNYFRSTQIELFTSVRKNPNQEKQLLEAHLKEAKNTLDSLYGYYQKHEEELILFSAEGKNYSEGNTFTPPPPGQPAYCENMDMEACNFSNWEIANGGVNNVPYGFINRTVTNLYNNGTPVNFGLQHSIASGAGWDPIVPISVIKPGGTCSAVLGDAMGDGYKAASMRRTFLVTPQNNLFTYSYAVIMEDPTNAHTAGERPYFTVRMWDENGNPLSCSNYEVYSGDGNPAWKSSPASPTGTPIVYTDWTDALIPLQAYVGQNITVEFATGDCNLGGHAAYAYVEANCGAQIEVTDTFVCPGLPVTLSAPTGASAYLWSTGETTQSITTQDSGMYSVVITATASGGCTSTLYKRIHLKESPIGIFKADTVCLNLATTFTDLSNPATTGIVNWKWDFNNDGIFDGSGQNTNYVFSSAGNHVVKLEVEDNNGCKDDTLYNIQVNDVPKLGFTANKPCLNDSTVLVNTCSNYASLKWDLFNNGTIYSTDSNATTLYSLVGKQNVKLTATSPDGCKDSIIQEIEVYPLPRPNFTNTEVCFPLSTPFTDASNSPNGAISSWHWDFGVLALNTDTSNTPNCSYSYPKNGSYEVKLIVTDAFGCSDSIVKQVKHYEKPVVSFSVENACKNSSFDFINESTVGSSSFNEWKWDIGANGSTEYSTKNAVHIFTSDGKDSVQLIGTTTEGCSDTLGKPVTIFPLPTAYFSVASQCQKSASTFVDKSTGSISSWHWDYFNDGSVDANIQNPNYIFPNAGTFDVELKVMTDKGCADSLVLPVTIYPSPVVGFNAPNVCFPLTTTFQNTTTLQSGNITSYLWNFGDNAASTSANQNPLFNYSSAGNYNVILKATTNRGCKDSLSQVIKVFAKPFADFIVKDTCVFKSVALSDRSTINGDEMKTWLWDINNDGAPEYNTKNAAHQFGQAGNYSIHLIVASTNNCMDTADFPITIFPQPSALFNYNNVCLNSTSIFTDASTSANGPIIKWEWDHQNNGSVESRNNNSQFNFSNAGNFATQLVVTDNKNCRDTIVSNSAVYPNPLSNFSSNAVCWMQESSFENLSQVANISGQNNVISSYLWNLGENGTTSSSVTPLHTYNLEGSYTVKLVVQTNNGCKDSTSKSVTVNPAPDVNMSSTVPEGCSKWCVDFTDASTIASGKITTYNWNFNNGVKSKEKNPSTCFTNPTQEPVYYDVELSITSDKGCTAKKIYNQYVTVYPLSIADFSYYPNITNELDPKYYFTNESLGSIWHWDFGDSTNSEEFSPMHLFPGAGKYDVILIANNVYNCPDTITKPVKIIPVTNFFAPNAITVNGDGMNEIFYIYGYNIIDFRMHIFDRWGLRLFTSNDIHDGWDGTYQGQEVQQDVYVYKAYITDIFNKEHVLVGTVTVVK